MKVLNVRMLLLILSLIFLGMAQAAEKDVKVEKKGSGTSISNKNDVVSYTTHKTDPAYISQLRKKYRGLNDEKKLDSLLSQQNYIEVLNHLWTEPNPTKRREWLERKVNQGHPILMFELGAEYYNQNPSMETYLTKSFPWIMAGVRRSVLDASCTSDRSAMAAPEFLLVTYQSQILPGIQKTHSEEEMQKYFENNKTAYFKNASIIWKKIFEPFVQNDQSKMPSPRWVFAHGMGSVSSKPNEIAEGQWSLIRKAEAQKVLDQIKELQ